MKIFIDSTRLVFFVDEAQGKKPPALWVEHTSIQNSWRNIQSNCCSKVMFVFRRESSVMPRHQVTRYGMIKFRTGPSGTVHTCNYERSVNILWFSPVRRIRIRIGFGTGLNRVCGSGFRL
jgi:hypothetical protein